MSVHRLLAKFAIGACAAAAFASQAFAASPEGMKLYVFTCDKFMIPVAFFLIKHKGNVLFDTGDNDKVITGPDILGAVGVAT